MDGSPSTALVTQRNGLPGEDRGAECDLEVHAGQPLLNGVWLGGGPDLTLIGRDEGRWVSSCGIDVVLRPGRGQPRCPGLPRLEVLDEVAVEVERVAAGLADERAFFLAALLSHRLGHREGEGPRLAPGVGLIQQSFGVVSNGAEEVGGGLASVGVADVDPQVVRCLAELAEEPVDARLGPHVVWRRRG